MRMSLESPRGTHFEVTNASPIPPPGNAPSRPRGGLTHSAPCGSAAPLCSLRIRRAALLPADPPRHSGSGLYSAQSKGRGGEMSRGADSPVCLGAGAPKHTDLPNTNIPPKRRGTHIVPAGGKGGTRPSHLATPPVVHSILQATNGYHFDRRD